MSDRYFIITFIDGNEGTIKADYYKIHPIEHSGPFSGIAEFYVRDPNRLVRSLAAHTWRDIREAASGLELDRLEAAEVRPTTPCMCMHMRREHDREGNCEMGCAECAANGFEPAPKEVQDIYQAELVRLSEIAAKDTMKRMRKRK